MKRFRLMKLLSLLVVCIFHAPSNVRCGDHRTHLAPPMGAMNAPNIDAWDKISCRVSPSHLNGESRTFVYTLTRERIERTTDWVDGELDPKLSPGSALILAKRKFATLKPFGDSNYRFELHMQQYWNKWLWAVMFFPTETDGVTIDSVFPVFVLMDGTTLRPEIEVRKKRQGVAPK